MRVQLGTTDTTFQLCSPKGGFWSRYTIWGSGFVPRLKYHGEQTAQITSMVAGYAAPLSTHTDFLRMPWKTGGVHYVSYIHILT